MDTMCFVCMCWTLLSRMSQNRRYPGQCLACVRPLKKPNGKWYADHVLWWCRRHQYRRHSEDVGYPRKCRVPPATWSGFVRTLDTQEEYRERAQEEYRERVAIEQRHDPAVRFLKTEAEAREKEIKTLSQKVIDDQILCSYCRGHGSIYSERVDRYIRCPKCIGNKILDPD
jgi:predicted nucleic acid-binding protein